MFIHPKLIQINQLLKELDVELSVNPVPDPDPEEPVILPGYIYEKSDSPNHVGEWYVMPPAKLNKKIKSIVIGSEPYHFVMDYNGRELWYGQPATGQMVVTLKSGEVDEDDFSGSTKEIATRFADTNDGMPTFYFKKVMSQYPSEFYLTVKGAMPRTLVTNNGSRWTKDTIVLKQSEVAGRTMGLLDTGKTATNAWIEY